MKAQLEKPCKNRGVILEPENDEDSGVLWELWTCWGKPVMLDYGEGKVKSLLIAPTAEKGEGDG